MNYMRLNEKMLKHNLKKKCRITLSLIVSFLITGSIGFLEEEIYAQDLRPRTKRDNDIKIDSSGGKGPSMAQSANKMDVVNIVEPNSGGISHNQFIDFSIGAENGAIFNNNATTSPVVTKTGGIVSQNPKITKSATAILSEVTGTKTSNIDGSIEIAGQKADFILANENGIAVNGGTFINTSGVTLTTGKPTVNNDTINLNVQKGNVSVGELGLGTSGDFFNIVSKTIELKGQVGVISGETDADITLIAGQNKVDIKKGNVAELKEVTGHAKDENQKYGIYASSLGAMYGKNIRLISTTEGLGVKHEGLVRGIGDININSAGDISVGALISENKIDIKGKKDFETTLGNFKNSTYYQNYSVSSNNGIKIDVKGDIIIQSMVDTGVEGLSIVGKNLTMKANSTAKILSQTELKIKLDGLLKIEATMIPKQPGRPYQKPPLVIEKDKNGQIVVKVPETGEILKPNEYFFISTGVIGDKIDINALEIINEAIITNGTSRRESYITLTALNSFLNKKLISSSGNLIISSEKKFENKKNGVIKGATVKVISKDLRNDGEMRQNISSLTETVDRGGNIEIDIKNGTFTNTGTLTGYNVDIKGEGFILNESEGAITASTLDYPRGMGKITIKARNIENKGTIQSYGKGIKNDIVIDTGSLTNQLGAVIIAKQGTLTITSTIGDLLNSGEYFADKDIMLISVKDIKNSGRIGGGSNLTVKAEKGKFENYGKISIAKKLLAHVNDFINAGSPEEITKYLTAFGRFVQENYEGVVKTIETLNKKMDTLKPGTEERKNLQEVLNYYKKLEVELKALKFDVERVGSLGIISADNMDIKTNSDFANHGMISSRSDIKIDSSKTIKNNGLLETGGSIDLKALEDIANTQRINAKENISISGKSFTSSGELKLLAEYLDVMEKYDGNTLKKAEEEIKELEKKLDTAKTETESKEFSKQLAEKRLIKEQQSQYKSKISILKNLSVIEGKNINIVGENGVTNNGLIKSKKSIDISANSGEIKNAGIIEAIEDVILKNTTGDILNTHRMTAEKKLDITGKSFTSRGKFEKIAEYKKIISSYSEILAKTTLTPKEESELRKIIREILTLAELGVVEGNSVDMKLENGFTNEGMINSKSYIKVDGGLGDIQNSGSISGKTDVGFKTKAKIDTKGTIKSENESIKLEAEKDITNKGILAARKKIELSTLENILNTHRMTAGGDITLSGKDIVLEGTKAKLGEYVKLLEKYSLLKEKKNKTEAENNELEKLKVQLLETIEISMVEGDSINIKGTGKFENKGIINSTKKIDIDTNSNISNSGSMTANNDIKIKSVTGDVTNTNKIRTQGALNISGKSLNVTGNSSKVEAYRKTLGEYITLKNKDQKTAEEIEKIQKLTAEILTYDDLGIIEGKSIDVNATGEIVNKGILEAKENINLKANSKNITNEGIVEGGKDVTLDTKEGAISTGGILKSIDESVSLNAKGKISNVGILEANKNINIKTVDGEVENTQRIISGEGINISSGKGVVSKGSPEKITAYNKLLESYSKLNAKQNKTDSEIKEFNELTEKILSFKDLGVIETKNLDVKAKGAVENNGIMAVDENIKITTEGNVTNSGELSSGKDLDIKGNNITNNGTRNIIVGNNLKLDGNNILNSKKISAGGRVDIKAKGSVENNELIAKENINIKSGSSIKSKILQTNKSVNMDGNSVTIEKKLDAGENFTSKVKNTNVEFESGSTVNVKKDLLVDGGGLINKGDLTVDGKITIRKESSTNSSFENTGNLNAGDNVSIDVSKTVKNSGDFNTGKKLDIKTLENFENKAKLQAKNGASFKSNGFGNTDSIILGGDTDVDAGTGAFISKTFETKGNLDIKAGDIKNNEKLQSSGNLKIKGGKFDNPGNILGQNVDIESSGDLFNTGKIEAKQGIKIKGTNSKLTNLKEIKSEGDIGIQVTKDIENKGSIASDKNLSLESKKMLNEQSGKIQGKNDVSIKIHDGFKNDTNAKILGGSINIDGKSRGVGGNFKNEGLLQSNGALTIDLGSNNVDVFLNSNNIKSLGLMKLITGGNIKNSGKFQNLGALDFNSLGDIENSGMLVSNGGIKLKSVNFDNKANSTVWSANDVVIETIKKIRNNKKSIIEAKGNINLKTEELQNLAGTIKSGKDIKLDTNTLTNKSEIFGGLGLETINYSVPNTYLSFNGKERYIKNALVNYQNIAIYMPKIKDNFGGVERASITAGGNLDIKGAGDRNTSIRNESGIIAATKNMDIKGNITNQTSSKSIEIEEILKKTRIVLNWTQHLQGSEDQVSSGTTFDGSLWTALTSSDKFDEYYYRALKISSNGLLEQILVDLLGENWKSEESLPGYSRGGKIELFASSSSAQIIAGNNFTHRSGTLSNFGGETGGYKAVNVQIGDKTVTGSKAALSVIVSNPNNITEVNGVKQVHSTKVQTDSVTLDGIIISKPNGFTTTETDGVTTIETAEGTKTTSTKGKITTILSNDGLITNIAIAGTINPITYIEIPTGENGIFKAARPNPEGRTPFKYETNIEFIDLSKYYGSVYFFKQVGHTPEKTSKVIGDAYYEQQLIDKTIREALMYSERVSANKIKTMLDNATNIKNNLNLEIGKPLTSQQINALEKDIIWYVELEVEGDIVLVPQVYFGKENRIKMAKSDTGGGYSSEIKIGNDIEIDAENFINSKGNIVAGNNIIIKSKNNIINNSSGGLQGGILASGNTILDAANDIDIIGGIVRSSQNNAELKAKGNITIGSTVTLDKNGSQKILNKGTVEAKKNIDIVAKKDTTIKAGKIESSGENNVRIKGQSVMIVDQNLIGSAIMGGTEDGITSTTTSIYSESIGSSITGENVNINSESNVGVKGSNIVAKKDVSINAKNNIDVTDSQNLINEKMDNSGAGFDDKGIFTVRTKNTERNISKSIGSTVGGIKGVNLVSDGSATIKGSDLISGNGGINITSKEDVNIIDGRDTEDFKFNSTSYKVIAFTKEDTERKTTNSKGSNLSTKGDVNINAKNNVKVIGSNLNTIGNTNVSAEKDVKFEAGKNTLEEKSNSLTVGITTVDAGVGIAGMSATGGWTPTGGGVGKLTDGGIGKQGDGKNPENANIMKGGNLGKNYMDSLTSAKTQIGVDIQNSSEKSETWTESKINTGGNLNVRAGGNSDIGGVDFNSGGDISIEGKQIETTKYEDKTEKGSSGITVGLQLSNNTTSSIADAVNKGAQIADTILNPDKELNEALTSAQVAGSVSNVIFGDLVGNTSAITGELALNNSNSKTTKENITDIKAKGNINIKSNDGDINLAGVDIKGDGIALDSSKDINIKDAKETNKDSSDNLSVSAGITSSSGVSILDGGFTQVGIAGNVQAGNSDKDNTISNRSIIEGTNVIVKSGSNTNIKGSNIKGDTIDLDIGGNLNIESVSDKYDENRVEGWGGVDISGGLATNTIGTGDVGLSAGGGNIYKKGEEIKNQSGIIANNRLGGKVKGNANLDGGVVGSKTGKGNLDINGNLNVKDMTTQLNAGGEILGGNIGTKGGGIRGEVGDLIDKNVTAKGGIGLNSNNVSIGGDVTLGRSGEKNEAAILGKVDNEIVVNKDATKGGGTFSGTGSVIAGKKKKDKKKNDVEFKIPRPEVIPVTSDFKIPRPEIVKRNQGYKIPRPEVIIPVTTNGSDFKIPRPEIVKQNQGYKIPRPEVIIPVTTNGSDFKIPRPEIVKQNQGYKIPRPDIVTTNTEFKIPRPDILPLPINGKVEKVTVLTAPTPVIKDVNIPKPEVAKVIEPPKTDVVDGYKKNPVTGKWEDVGNRGMGIIATNGSITNKRALDGYGDGVKSLDAGTTTVPNRDDTGITIAPITQGDYTKNPVTGKWEKKEKALTPDSKEKTKLTETNTESGNNQKNKDVDTSSGGWEETLVTTHSEGPSIFNDNMSPNDPGKTKPPVPPKPNAKVPPKVAPKPVASGTDISTTSNVKGGVEKSKPPIAPKPSVKVPPKVASKPVALGSDTSTTSNVKGSTVKSKPPIAPKPSVKVPPKVAPKPDITAIANKEPIYAKVNKIKTKPISQDGPDMTLKSPIGLPPKVAPKPDVIYADLDLTPPNNPTTGTSTGSGNTNSEPIYAKINKIKTGSTQKETEKIVPKPVLEVPSRPEGIYVDIDPTMTPSSFSGRERERAEPIYVDVETLMLDSISRGTLGNTETQPGPSKDIALSEFIIRTKNSIPEVNNGLKVLEKNEVEFQKSRNTVENLQAEQDMITKKPSLTNADIKKLEKIEAKTKEELSKMEINRKTQDETVKNLNKVYEESMTPEVVLKPAIKKTSEETPKSKKTVTFGDTEVKFFDSNSSGVNARSAAILVPKPRVRVVPEVAPRPVVAGDTSTTSNVKGSTVEAKPTVPPKVLPKPDTATITNGEPIYAKVNKIKTGPAQKETEKVVPKPVLEVPSRPEAIYMDIDSTMTPSRGRERSEPIYEDIDTLMLDNRNRGTSGNTETQASSNKNIALPEFVIKSSLPKVKNDLKVLEKNEIEFQKSKKNIEKLQAEQDNITKKPSLKKDDIQKLEKIEEKTKEELTKMEINRKNQDEIVKNLNKIYEEKIGSTYKPEWTLREGDSPIVKSLKTDIQLMNNMLEGLGTEKTDLDLKNDFIKERNKLAEKLNTELKKEIPNME